MHARARTFLKLALLRSDFSDVGVVARLVLERLLPDLAEADRRVEAVEDGQRHRHVGDDRPHPLAAVKFDLKKVGSRISLPHLAIGSRTQEQLSDCRKVFRIAHARFSD